VQTEIQFTRDGFIILESLVESGKCDLLSAELTPFFEQKQKKIKSKIGGLRNLLRTNLRVAQLAKSPEMLSILKKINGCSVFPVRAIFFDKNPETNWHVQWHQDLAIAVVEQIETSGFTGWSIKDGTVHVHPPRDILEGMLTVRLHLDDCDASNGALKVIPRSHSYGRFSADEIAAWSNRPATICEVPKGDALLMRPLLLHSSSAAKNPSHRRVLHIEYATHELSNGLKWSHS
jgi:ectoine hydroxylase-related dioxygenase (phytanoyl-CoA dioxygenase family)